MFILPMLYCFILMFTNGILKGNMDAFPFAAIFIVDLSYVIYLKVRKDPSIEASLQFVNLITNYHTSMFCSVAVGKGLRT